MDYCQESLSNSSLNLLAVAERFPILSERIAVDPREAVRDELLLWCMVGPLFAGALGYAGATNGAGIGAGLAVGVLVVMIAVALRTLGAYRKAAAVSGSIKVENGRLTIRHPVYGKAAWALRDCRWHLGKAWEAETFLPRLYLRRKVVIIECPVKVRFLWRMREKVPCGLTDEMREVWVAFLTLAGVDRTPRCWWWPLWRRLPSGSNTPPTIPPNHRP
jgi:hypothetical protein